jgi:acetyltransferase
LAAAINYGSRVSCDPNLAPEITLEFKKRFVKVETASSGISIMDEHDSKHLLGTRQIPVVEEIILNNPSEAEDVIRQWGFPVVIKGLLEGETHKTEFGLVHLGIFNRFMLEEAFHKIKARTGDQGRILIQRQIKTDYELIAGFLRDEEFGPCVMFGLGGIFAELEPDVAFALAPLKHERALRLIDQIRGKKLLDGFRGMAPLKKDLMSDILVRLGELGTTNSHIQQIDINPLAVSGGSPVAIDANIVLNASRDHGERKI